MASHFSRFSNFLAGIIFGSGFGALLSIAPVAAIEHKRLIHFFTHQPVPQSAFQAIVVAASAFAWALAFAKLDRLSCGNGKAWLKANSFTLLSTLFLFLYVACAYLCDRLHVAPMPTSFCDKESWQWLGDFFTLFAGTVIAASLLSPAKQRPQAGSSQKTAGTVEHPICLAGLIYLLGSSLSFATWFPLLAIPGAFVFLLWHIRKEANATIGDVRARWLLMPYIF